MKTISALVAVSVLLFAGSAKAQIPSPADREQAMKLIAQQQLPPETVKTLEEGLKAKPDDLEARAKLLRHYFIARIFSPSSALEEKRQQHIFWIIENHPEAEFAGSPDCSIDPIGTEGGTEGFQRAKKLWLEQVEKHSDNKLIVRHAAQFLGLYEKKLGRELLEKALALDPSDTESAEQLAHSYELDGRYGTSAEESSALMKKALTLRERALDPAPGRMRFYGLADITETAFAAGETDKAQRYANELLQAANESKDDWNYGNAIHTANIVLGQIALRNNDLRGAKFHLLAAGETPGSPQLNSFGPSMDLAKELLEKGERETVLAYLQACTKFWKMGEDRLQNWMATIRGGGTPDFR